MLSPKIKETHWVPTSKDKLCAADCRLLSRPRPCTSLVHAPQENPRVLGAFATPPPPWDKETSFRVSAYPGPASVLSLQELAALSQESQLDLWRVSAITLLCHEAKRPCP